MIPSSLVWLTVGDATIRHDAGTLTTGKAFDGCLQHRVACSHNLRNSLQGLHQTGQDLPTMTHLQVSSYQDSILLREDSFIWDEPFDQDTLFMDIAEMASEGSFFDMTGAPNSSNSIQDKDTPHPTDCVSSILASLKAAQTAAEASYRVVSSEDLTTTLNESPLLATNQSFFLSSEISTTNLSLKRRDDSMFNGAPIASVFSKPSSFLRAALLVKNSASDRPLKKRKREASNSHPTDTKGVRESISPLHLACLRSAVTVKEIDQLLRRDARAAAKSVTLTTSKTVVDPVTLKQETKSVKEMYTLPLLIAIKNQASSEVLKMLINAAPSVLLLVDGHQRESPLCAYLRLTPFPDLSVIEEMICKSPKCAFTVDRHDNTVMHVACARGADVDILQRLCQAFPQGLKRRNFHGKTPSQLVQQRTVTCSDDLSRLMWSCKFA
jgi:hypothetical protein